jgi:hypothetical protein
MIDMQLPCCHLAGRAYYWQQLGMFGILLSCLCFALYKYSHHSIIIAKPCGHTFSATTSFQFASGRVCVCVCVQAICFQGVVVITRYQLLPLPPRESPPHLCHPVVLPLRSPWGAFWRGFQRVPCSLDSVTRSDVTTWPCHHCKIFWEYLLCNN